MTEKSVGRVSVVSDTRFLAQVRGFVRDVVATTPLSEKIQNLIILAVDEAVANVVEHAYAPGTSGDIEVEALCGDGHVAFVVKDRGAQFDPRGAGDVDMGLHVKSRAKDGLGLFMIRRIMDEIDYEFVGGENRLRLVKFFSH